jgi:CubicO group peptidase (beta-lactamase class C family)
LVLNLIAPGAGFAILRDYAKLGVLYLQNGVWDGDRLLPQGRADYAERDVSAKVGFGRLNQGRWVSHDAPSRVPPEFRTVWVGANGAEFQISTTPATAGPNQVQRRAVRSSLNP